MYFLNKMTDYFSGNLGRKTLLNLSYFNIFLGSKSLQMVTASMKLKDACSLEEKL